MKRVFYVLGATALMVLSLASCNKNNGKDSDINWDAVVEDGFYVAGEATGSSDIKGTCVMTAGVNEVTKESREGMFEKYIVLEGGKEFYLIYNEAGKKVRYSAELKEFQTPSDNESYGDNPESVLKGALQTGDTAPAMKVAKTGLYHIVLDINKSGDLDAAGGAQIVLLDASNFGVRGDMNSWGFTASDPAVTTFSNDGITWTFKGQELAGNGFKFATGNYWKVTLDDAGKVKAETSLGKDFLPKDNIPASDGAGIYDITLTFKLAAGSFDKSFSMTLNQTAKSELPTEMYMIGAAFGNWTFGSEGIVRLPKTPWKDGCFVVTRFFKAGEGFKFSTINEPDNWSKAFAGRANNSENITFDGDGNVVVPSDGLWTISINIPDDTMTLQATEIAITGPCTGIEGDDMWKLENAIAGTVDNVNGTATVTAAADGDLRVYCKSAFDWWQHEFKPDGEGGIMYRGLWTPAEDAGNAGEKDNAELPAFNVIAGSKVTFDFNAGTAVVNR
ncbi:MAG: hypothetical protein IJ795_07625 [Bacteroidales bacterium]|nr:hypothetical protein [Bacteroidales bacterium]